MSKIKKIIAAAASAVLVLILMCGCESSSQKAEYERLKTEIVGMWMNEGGPVVDTDGPFGKSLRFFEFTSTGEVYHHFVYMNEGIPSDGAIQTSTYYLDENMLVNVAGSEEDGDLEKTGALIEINGDIMTMSNNAGSTNYVKLSLEDATGYSVFYKDAVLNEKQQQLINGSAMGEYSADESETSAETSDETEESTSESTGE